MEENKLTATRFVANTNYFDLELQKDIEAGTELHEVYEQAGVELTKERLKFLVSERELYNVETTKAEAQGEEDSNTDETNQEPQEDSVDEQNDKEDNQDEVEEEQETDKDKKSKTKNK